MFKKMSLFFMVMVFIYVPNIYAVDIVITLTQEQYDAMSVMTVTPDEWAQHAVETKANKMIEALVTKYSDKQPSKISEADKKIIFKNIDLDKERDERRGKSQP